MLRCEILSVGTALILGDILDTNAQYLSVQLASMGIAVHRRSTVGDNAERLSREVRQALSRSDLVLLTGNVQVSFQACSGPVEIAFRIGLCIDFSCEKSDSACGGPKENGCHVSRRSTCKCHPVADTLASVDGGFILQLNILLVGDDAH